MKDFDKFFAEVEKKPIEFKLFGEVEKLPPSLPATIFLKLARAYKKYGNEDLPEHVMLDLAFEIFSEKKVEKWCDKGLTLDQLSELMQYAMSRYNEGAKKK